jgi:hypothetical protein
MLKYLILPAVALVLSLSTHAQVKVGVALDYEHIQSDAFSPIGNGKLWGGSVFFHFPVSKLLELDWSADAAGGNIRGEFWVYPPFPNDPPFTVSENRHTFYLGVPVHLVYDFPFRGGRVFAGPGIAWSHLRVEGTYPNGYHNTTGAAGGSMIAASFKAGFQLYKYFTLSGEFRPWISNASTSPSNLLSLKLGYELGPLKQSSHSRPDK